MTMKTVGTIAGLSVAAFLAGSQAQANTYTIDAINPVASWTDLGTLGTAAKVFTALGTWSAGETTSRTSDADGIDPSTLVDGTGPGSYGQWTMLGYTFNYGALVGEVGGTFFLIGAGPTMLSGLTGDVHAGYWDSYYGDNTGSVALTVTGVPEASTWIMMLAGFAGLGFAGFRARKHVTRAA